jgi:glycosyltransferase involved in cell wall biosynthesis
MPKKIKLSVVLATFNEAKNISRCLDSVADLADEIVVVDGKSVDNTGGLAKKYKARVILTDNQANFHIMKNMAIDAAAGEWILQLDADEALSPELKTEIKTVITSSDSDAGYFIPRMNYFFGKPLTKGGQYPDYTLRLYKNGLGRLPAKDVHEQAVVNGPVGYLKNNLLHFNTPDFENYLLRYNRYTSLMASEFAGKKIPLNFFVSLEYLFLKPLVEFFNIYIRHKGFVDKFPGFVFALFSGLRFGVAYIKYWQITEYPASNA